MSNTARSKQFIKNKRRITALARVWNTYKQRAKRSGIVFSISKELFYSLITSKCDICGKKPSNKYIRPETPNVRCMYNGIDRIDNSLGYVDGNVRTCCSLCNSMKSNLKERVFKKHLIRIAQKMAERKSRRQS